MKTNAKKRMLISSVAMLLVAMLALGTATFAWFSTSTTARANNIKVQTTKASNLLIRKGTGGTAASADWAGQIDYASDGATTLEPASTTDLTNWFKALAPSYDSAGEKENSIEKLTTKTGYVVENNFQLYYNADTSAADLAVNWGLAITPTETGDEDFLRVAIVDVDENDVVFVYGNGNDDNSLRVNAENNEVFEHSGASNVTTTDASGSLVTMKAQNIKNYKMVIWYEGTDEECLDSNAVTLNNISFTFSKAS